MLRQGSLYDRVVERLNVLEGSEVEEIRKEAFQALQRLERS
jgi:hypothetical protein